MTLLATLALLSVNSVLDGAVVQARPTPAGASAEAPASTGPPAPPAVSPPARSLRLAPAAVETGGILALEILWYESLVELNKRDFDFDRTAAGQRRRWSRLYGVRFDDNTFGINMGHAYYNGSFYYDVARVLGGSILESWLFTLATSSVWEATIEHREVFSLNDTVVTPAGGAAIGEAFYQLGRFFERGSPTVANRVLTTLFSPAHTLNDLVGLTRPERTTDVDSLGLPRDVWHRFELDLGAALGGGSAGRPRRELWLSLDTDLVAVPGHGRPGELAQTLDDGQWSRVHLRYASDADGLTELGAYAQASLWGRYRQRLQDREGALSGHSLFYGAATAFDLSIARLPTFQDFIGIMHVVGPTTDATWHHRGLSLRGGLTGFLDFAMPRSVAWEKLQRQGAVLPTTKSVLEDQGYTHAWGFTGAAMVEARWRGFELAGELRYDWLDSIEGRDRRQDSTTSPTGTFHEGVVDDFNVRDQRRTLRAALSWQLPGKPWTLRLWGEDRLRTGQARGVEASYRAQRVGLSVSATL